MHKLYELKEKLIDELESYADTSKITPSTAEEIKVLSASVDHLCNICDAEEDNFSMRGGMSYENDGNMSRRNSRNDGYSMARGRGRNAQRDSRGRYSGADGDIEDIKRAAQRLMETVEKM